MRVSAIVCAVLLAGVAGNVSAQQEDLSGVEIKSAPLGTGLYLLTGAGGNIAALTGADGVLLVDAEFGALAERIRAALKGLGAEQPPRFIIDTHYHYDHTDGNEAFAKMGALVIAQTQLRSRLVSGGTAGNGGSISKEMKPAPPGGLPGLTYEQELTLYLDGEAVRVHHYPHAHTDGDSVVFFPRAKAVHMGDIFVRYGFPFIDINGGGNVRGMIAACEDVRAQRAAGHQDHPRSRRGRHASTDLREYTEMLKSTTALVEQALAAGKTLEQMKQEKLLGAYSARYAPAKAFVDTDAFTESLYNSLKMPRPRHGPVRRPR